MRIILCLRILHVNILYEEVKISDYTAVVMISKSLIPTLTMILKTYVLGVFSYSSSKNMLN